MLLLLLYVNRCIYGRSYRRKYRRLISFSVFFSSVPNNASDTLRRLIETLFITHTEAQLNTDGHLDRLLLFPDVTIDQHDSPQEQPPQTLWCENLLRHPFVHNI